eukprot:TRINITY_DN17757_c0_g1_i3.p1 TRINITY_DN17757_c0_g1~~TRINITY_DN17757_c0_g1_i3.p1  ORF type:complete len:308 (-),score=114.70 TRINITY_DN17757_c0_g1_i3:43-966(-)
MLLDRNLSNLRGDMQRFNTLIAQARTQEEALQSTNLRLESEFKNRLVVLEKECIGMENSVDLVKDEKSTCIEDIKEAESQIMFLERKIQLAKETIEALDPNVGRAENTKMQQEIHRMELRYVQLKKKQQDMIKEMEDAIYRKEQIKTKGKNKIKNAGGGSAGTLKQELSGLDKAIKESEASLEQYDDSIAQYQETYNQRLTQDQDLNEGIAQMKEQIAELQDSYETKVETKKVMLESIMRNQKASKHLTKVAKEDELGSTVAVGQVQAELDAAEEEGRRIMELMSTLDTQMPTLNLSRSLKTLGLTS